MYGPLLALCGIECEMPMIIDFYENAGPDSEGRYLEEIWAWSDDDLMAEHDWIQWLFPTDHESDFIPTRRS